MMVVRAAAARLVRAGVGVGGGTSAGASASASASAVTLWATVPRIDVLRAVAFAARGLERRVDVFARRFATAKPNATDELPAETAAAKGADSAVAVAKTKSRTTKGSTAAKERKAKTPKKPEASEKQKEEASDQTLSAKDAKAAKTPKPAVFVESYKGYYEINSRAQQVLNLPAVVTKGDLYRGCVEYVKTYDAEFDPSSPNIRLNQELQDLIGSASSSLRITPGSSVWFRGFASTPKKRASVRDVNAKIKAASKESIAERRAKGRGVFLPLPLRQSAREALAMLSGEPVPDAPYRGQLVSLVHKILKRPEHAEVSAQKPAKVVGYAYVLKSKEAQEFFNGASQVTSPDVLRFVNSLLEPSAK